MSVLSFMSNGLLKVTDRTIMIDLPCRKFVSL